MRKETISRSAWTRLHEIIISRSVWTRG